MTAEQQEWYLTPSFSEENPDGIEIGPLRLWARCHILGDHHKVLQKLPGCHHQAQTHLFKSKVVVLVFLKDKSSRFCKPSAWNEKNVKWKHLTHVLRVVKWLMQVLYPVLTFAKCEHRQRHNDHTEYDAEEDGYIPFWVVKSQSCQHRKCTQLQMNVCVILTPNGWWSDGCNRDLFLTVCCPVQRVWCGVDSVRWVCSISCGIRRADVTCCGVCGCCGEFTKCWGVSVGCCHRCTGC